MIRKYLFMTILVGGGLLSCGDAVRNKPGERDKMSEKEIIEKTTPTIENGLLTPELLYSFGRVANPVLSPDRQQILYQTTYPDIDENSSTNKLYIMDIDGSGKRELRYGNNRESNFHWIEEGKKIAFLSDKSGSSQIWTMNPDDEGVKQLSDIDEGIDGFIFSPDETKILLVKRVKSVETASDRYSDLPMASGRIVDDLMYKHWDHWVESVPHPFLADISDGKLTNISDLMEGEPYESPMVPFGGVEQLAWSPDGKTIAYSSRKKTGKEYAVSTNSDIYFYDVESGETRNMTEGMMGYDLNPLFSPDGSKLAWLSMERDGYEADKNRLFVMDLTTGEKTYLTEEFDYNVEDFVWGDDSRTIYMVSPVKGTNSLYSVDIVSREISEIAKGMYDYISVDLADGCLITKRQSMSQPAEIYSVDLVSGEAVELSLENRHILNQLRMGEIEERWITTTDAKEMLTWVVYPPDFDPAKSYPTLLYCQGGPQSMVSQFWSYRWNLQMMAANGYIIVAPNRRGLPGFGQEWLEQISGDYGGQNMRDYLSAIDAVAKEPYVDNERLGCTGASYGGFSTLWLAGNHDKRFKAFYAHAGIFNLEAQYLETEEMFFANWDMGGPYWDRLNAVAQRTYATSPHRFVDRWDRPIMVSHGEFDYRILASQSMMAFNAARLRDIPSRMLIFPDENHWITKPQNGILFQREFFRWFDEWLK